MEQTASKVKKWGWWAVVGLVGILVIAGLIIAIASLGPKPTTDTEAATDGTSGTEGQEDVAVEEEPALSDDKPAEQDSPAGEDNFVNELPAIIATPEADLPKTGPEDSIVPVLGAGVVGYLLALGFGALRRRG